MEELDQLIDLQRLYCSPITMVGLQKHYAPAVQLLKQSLRKERLISYDLHYLTGAYPESNALPDLYIHPLGLVCHLFGQPEILVCRQVAKDSYILMLQHPHIVGTLELSTAYTWTTAKESLKVCTRSGVYDLTQMESLAFTPNSTTFLGIPIEKMRMKNSTVEYLYQCNYFTPILINNQIYMQGYFNEITNFINAVEGLGNQLSTSFKEVRDVYEIIGKIKGT